jgi:hypothetical protein
MLKFLDLPAHPFFVHGPVVLLPLMTLVALILTIRPNWRAKAWPFFTGGIVVLFVSMMLAMQSGEALDAAFKGLAPTKRHIELAETTRLFTFGLLVLTLAQAMLIRRRFGTTTESNGSMVLLERIGACAVVLLGVIATVWTIRTGHEGAKAVWSQTKL